MVTETQLSMALAAVADDVTVTDGGDRATIEAGGQTAVVSLHRRRSLTPSSARALTTSATEPGLVVTDRIDSVAAATLRECGWSWWDRQGRLRPWLPEIGLRLDTPTRSYVTGADGPDPRHPVAGAGADGISLALALLSSPTHPPGIREAALDLSTSSRGREILADWASVRPNNHRSPSGHTSARATAPPSTSTRPRRRPHTQHSSRSAPPATTDTAGLSPG